MRYSVVTFGCRVNQADSLRIEEGLRARGATDAAPAEADLVVVNTCSVTATADQGARQTIRRLISAHEFEKRAVRGRFLAIVAAADQRQRARTGGLGTEGLGERRLAEARRAAEQHQPTVPVQRRPQPLPEQPKLAVTADECARPSAVGA